VGRDQAEERTSSAPELLAQTRSSLLRSAFGAGR
jgi:hypothetical protein